MEYPGNGRSDAQHSSASAAYDSPRAESAPRTAYSGGGHDAPAQHSPVARPPDGLVVRGLTHAVRLSVAAAMLPYRLARPVVMSRPMAPAREAANGIVSKVSDALVSVVAEQLLYNNEAQTLVEEYAERLLILLAHNRQVEKLVHAQAAAYIGYLVENPAAIGPLVEGAASQYIAALQQNPTRLQPLVRAVADNYVDYLSRNPEIVAGVVEVVATDYVAWLQERPSVVDALVRTVGNRYVAYLAENQALVDELVKGVAGGYVEYLTLHPELAGDLVENVAANFIVHLQEHPAQLDGVVAAAAERFMAQTRQDPAQINALVQVVGDQYLEYLRVYPDNVQDLLAGQTASITGDVITEVRQRSASGDVKLETAIRNFLRMKPREDTPVENIPSVKRGA